MKLDFANQRILVTGSSRGIGQAIAQAFAQANGRVCVTSRGAYSAPDWLGAGGLVRRCDFTQPTQIEALRNEILSQWGGLDILVCNVGSGASTPQPVPDADHFARVFDLNFTSAVDTTRVFLPLLQQQGQGTAIVYVSSICGQEAIEGAPTDYAAAKGALQHFAKNVARKVAATQVRVNCVAPGNILFPGGTWEKKQQEHPERVSELLQRTVPLQRFGTPAEVAHACLFLCSPYASFITGTTLVVDGGQTAHV